MPKQTQAEQLEQNIVADIAQEAGKLNGNPSTEVATTTPKMQARLAMIQAGLTEMQAIASERDEAIARAEKAEAEIVNLLNLADQAREGERLRLKEVSDRAISEARAAMTQQEVLQGEIDNLRMGKTALEARVMEAQAETAKFKTLAMMIRASLDKMLPSESQ